MPQPLSEDRVDLESLVLDRYLPFRLSHLANRVMRTVAGVYAQRFQLSAPEWRTIAVLGSNGEMPANMVGESTAMDKVRVSRAVTRLLAAGRVTRRVDPTDRRRIILQLTPVGLDVHRSVVPLVRAVEESILAEFTAEERAMFDTLIGRLEDRLKRIPAAGAQILDP